MIDLAAAALSGFLVSMIATTVALVGQTLLDGRKGRALVREWRGAAEEAVAAYQARLLLAVEDVKNALPPVADPVASSRDSGHHAP